MKRMFSFVCWPNAICLDLSFLFVVFLIIIHVNGCAADGVFQNKIQDKHVNSHVEENHDEIKQGKPKLLSQSSQSGRLECAEEDKACEKDRLGLEAIRTLHVLIDDDHNGNVDQSESDEFLRDELQYTDGFERQALFHNNDKLISVDDLWRAWKHSIVYNWTVDNVIEWLVEDVDLPQYSHTFHHYSIDGSYLPRLVNSTGTLLAMLGIRNPVHKQKLSLKAMDTVLFGAPKRVHSYVKDVLLISSLIITFGGAWFTYLQHRYSKTQYNKMLKDLESLQKAEEALKKLSKDISEAEKNQKSISQEQQEELKLLRKGSARLKLPNVQRVNGDASPTLSRESSLVRRQEGEKKLKQAEEELMSLREALYEAEYKLEAQQQLEAQGAVPGELQAWLQLTHELELLHYNAKHQAAERQLLAARDGCDKIKRRNKAFFGSLRMAHSNSMDDIDQTLLDARAALEEVKQDLQERLHRWHIIEFYCSFPIITNPGLANLKQILGRDSPSGNPNRSIQSSLLAPNSIDEGDEDLPPAGSSTPVLNHCTGFPALASGTPKTFLKQQTLTGSTGSLSHQGKTPSQGQTASTRHENEHQSFAPVPQNSSVLFHLGEGPNAHHERSHSNASSAYHPSSNGHAAHHLHHIGQSYGHSRSGLTPYSQSPYAHPPIKQSSMVTLQAPGSHLSGVSSTGTLSRTSGSHSGSYNNVRSGPSSSSNSNLLALSGQKVVGHNHEEHDEGPVVNSGSPHAPRPQLPDSLPVNLMSESHNTTCNTVDSWESESMDSHHQTTPSSNKPQMLRTPEFEDSNSIEETESLQSASALANSGRSEKKSGKKKKYLPSFLRKNSTKQKTS